MIKINWTSKEQNLMEQYFKSSSSEMSLYLKLHKINPSRTYEAMMRRIRLMRDGGWEKNKTNALKKLRVGYLDIEATNLNGDFGYILSWFIKHKGKDKYDFSVIKKSEIFNYTFDKRVVKELLEALKNYDVIYAHYGADYRFDIPFIRTRAFKHGLEGMLPMDMELFIMDTYDIAKKKLKLHSNRLGSIGEAVGIKDVKKTPLSPEQWSLATAGHPDALAYIVKHNQKDVQLLEKIHFKLECVQRPVYKSM